MRSRAGLRISSMNPEPQDVQLTVSGRVSGTILWQEWHQKEKVEGGGKGGEGRDDEEEEDMALFSLNFRKQKNKRKE